MSESVEPYYLPPSHYCLSVDRMLAFKGIPAKKVYPPYHDRQELLPETGKDYAPTLIWGGKPVSWNEIPAILDRVRPDPPLLPKGQEGIARALENWGHQVLEERVWRAVATQIPRLLRTDQERRVFEEMQSAREVGSTETLTDLAGRIVSWGFKKRDPPAVSMGAGDTTHDCGHPIP